MKNLAITMIFLVAIILIFLRISTITHKINDPKEKIELLVNSIMKKDSVDYYLADDFKWYQDKVAKITFLYSREKSLFFPNYKLINHAADLMIVYGANLNIITNEMRKSKRKSIKNTIEVLYIRLQ